MERLNTNTPPRTPNNQGIQQRNSLSPVRQQAVAQDVTYGTPINQIIPERANKLPIRPQITQIQYLTVQPDPFTTPTNGRSAPLPFMPCEHTPLPDGQEQAECAIRVVTEETIRSTSIPDNLDNRTEMSSLQPRT